MAEEITREELQEQSQFFAALLTVIATENGGKRIIDLSNYSPGVLTVERNEDVVTISCELGKAN